MKCKEKVEKKDMKSSLTSREVTGWQVDVQQRKDDDKMLRKKSDELKTRETRRSGKRKTDTLAKSVEPEYTGVVLNVWHKSLKGRQLKCQD